jgi:hypothetical protein
MPDNNSKYILDKLSDINMFTTYAVDADYLERANAKAKSYKDNNGKSRTYEEKRLDIDCEFADEIVNHSGKDFILEPTEVRKHDFRFKKMPEEVVWCVDNKVVHEEEFYLHMNKYTQYLESYREGKLHYFAFWKFMERPIKPLKLGDKPEMLVLSVIPAGELLMKMCDPKKMTKSGDKFKIKVV